MKIFFLSVFLTAFSFCSASLQPNYTEQEAEKLLSSFHSKLSLLYGTFQEEYPEQVMAAMFISPHDRVLEIGGNIGRNSCVIASLLNNSSHLVVAESNPTIANQLIANRNLNHLFFHVEPCAISKTPLFQSGWETLPLQYPGFSKIDTISYEQLKQKYGFLFNVLVADCEGALYYILQDDESLLEDMDLIIVENDYKIRSQYMDVLTKFIVHGFQLVYNKEGGWGPCYDEFYQVWKKP